MSALDDVGRMLALVPWLLERPGASLAETADAFGVSPSSASARTSSHLDFCGLPGLGGGDLFDVSIVEDRVVVTMADELKRPLRPTPAEALRLVLTVDAVAEVLGDELPALTSAVAKVREALGVPEGVADVLEPSATSAVAEVRRALKAGRRVPAPLPGTRRRRHRGTRRSTRGGSRSSTAAWYLQGHDHEAGGPAHLPAGPRRRRRGRPTSRPTCPRPRTCRHLGTSPVRTTVEVELAVTRGGRWLVEALDVDRTEDAPDGGARLHLTTDAPRHVARLGADGRWGGERRRAARARSRPSGRSPRRASRATGTSPVRGLRGQMRPRRSSGPPGRPMFAGATDRRPQR